MTREELERHLELKQSTKPQYMSLGQTMNTLPDDIFGNEDSNQGGSVFTEALVFGSLTDEPYPPCKTISAPRNN